MDWQVLKAKYTHKASLKQEKGNFSVELAHKKDERMNGKVGGQTD